MNYDEKDIERGALALYITIHYARNGEPTPAQRRAALGNWRTMQEDSKETWHAGARAVLEAADTTEE